VATPLLAPDGSLIAAISAAIDPAAADCLDDLGEELKKYLLEGSAGSPSDRGRPGLANAA
jgi:hypothetical protein